MLSYSALPAFNDPLQKRYFKVFNRQSLTLSTRTCTEWVQLTFQLKWALGEVADIFTRKIHKSFINLLLSFEAMYLALRAPSFTDSSLLQLEQLMQTYFTCLHAAFGANSPFKRNLRKPKNHAYSHIVAIILEYGSLANTCTFHFEKAHCVTKDAAARTNNKSHQEQTMLTRIVNQSHLNTTFAVYEQQRQDDEAPTAKRARANADAAGNSTLQLTKSGACGLGSISPKACRRLQPDIRDSLLHLLEQRTGKFITVQHIKLHPALSKVTNTADGVQQCSLKVHCRDAWGSSSGGNTSTRYDNVVVQLRNEAGLLVERYARLVAILRYYKVPLVLIKLYTPVTNNRSIRISQQYLRHTTTELDLRLLDANAVLAAAHLIKDCHDQGGELTGRWFVNSSSSHCL